MKHHLLVTAMMLAAITVGARTLRLGDTSDRLHKSTAEVTPQTPQFDISVAQDSTSATFTVRIPTVDVNPDTDLYPSTYWWSVDEFFPSSVAGEASLPQRSLIFQLPGNAENITLTENYARWQTIGDYPPTPARPPLPQEPGVAYSLENVPPISQYASAEVAVATISCISRQRDSKIAYIHVQPFKYTGIDGTVNVCHEFSYTLEFDKTDIITPLKLGEYSPSTILNTDVEAIEMGEDMSIQPPNIGINDIPLSQCAQHIRASNYLIITTSEYLSQMQSYARWKNRLGHKVHIASAEIWNQKTIKSTIQSYYRQDPNLHYVLFAGSTKKIPATSLFSGNSESINYSDFPYAVINYTDSLGYERSVYTGRLIADSPIQMKFILDKLYSVYKLGANNPSYHKNAAHISFFDSKGDTESGTYMVKTSEDARNHVIANGKNVSRLYYKHHLATPKYWMDKSMGISLMPPELQYPTFTWDADSIDVIDAFNANNHYILYNGHGGTSSWGYADNWRNPIFKTEFLSRVSNQNRLPFVFGITCNTGDMTSVYGLAKSMLNSKNGAYGVIASTRSIPCVYASLLTLGIFKTIWPTPEYDTNFINPNITINLDPFRFSYDKTYQEYVDEEWYTFGNILDLGERYEYLSTLRPTKPTDNLSLVKEYFHIYGDPGIFFNTETPTDIEDVHFAMIPGFKNVDGTQKFYICLSLPYNAIIGIYNETTRQVTRYYTDYVTHPVDQTDKFYVTVTKHNKIPLQFGVDHTVITASGPYIGSIRNMPELRFKSVRQDTPSSIEVGYAFDECESARYNGDIIVKDLNNTVIAHTTVHEQKGTVILSSPQITQGIYVVTMQSPTHSPNYTKILIK